MNEVSGFVAPDRFRNDVVRNGPLLGISSWWSSPLSSELDPYWPCEASGHPSPVKASLKQRRFPSFLLSGESNRSLCSGCEDWLSTGRSRELQAGSFRGQQALLQDNSICPVQNLPSRTIRDRHATAPESHDIDPAVATDAGQPCRILVEGSRTRGALPDLFPLRPSRMNSGQDGAGTDRGLRWMVGASAHSAAKTRLYLRLEPSEKWLSRNCFHQLCFSLVK